MTTLEQTERNDGLMEDAFALAEYEGKLSPNVVELILLTHELAKKLMNHELMNGATIYPKNPTASGDAVGRRSP